MYTGFGTAFSIHNSPVYAEFKQQTHSPTKNLLCQLFVWLLFVCFSLVAHHQHAFFVPTFGQHLSLDRSLFRSLTLSSFLILHFYQVFAFQCTVGEMKRKYAKRGTREAQAQTEEIFFMNNFGIQYQEMFSNDEADIFPRMTIRKAYCISIRFNRLCIQFTKTDQWQPLIEFYFSFVNEIFEN